MTLYNVKNGYTKTELTVGKNESVDFVLYWLNLWGNVSMLNHSLPHRSGAVTNSSPVWNLSRSNKESDASSVEDSGQAYVVGKYAEPIVCVSTNILLSYSSKLLLCFVKCQKWSLFSQVSVCTTPLDCPPHQLLLMV